MKCILLCAGYATRLFPLTENFPKALLEVGGRPIIDYTLDEVNTIDEVDGIFLVTNSKYAPHFKEWAAKKNNVKPIVVIDDGTTTNDDRLGAIGDIDFTLNKCGINDDILVLATDNLFTFSLKDFYNFYKLKNAPVICVREEKNRELLKRLGVAEISEENMQVIGFEEKPAEPKGKYGVYAEYIYPKNVLPIIKEYLADGNSSDAPGNLVAYMHQRIPTFAYSFEGECYDVGTHDALAMVNKLYSNK